MSGFILSVILARVAASLQIAQTALEEKVNELAQKFPDAAQFLNALETYLVSVVPADKVAELANTIKGFALDIRAGVLKVDPGAWQGEV